MKCSFGTLARAAAFFFTVTCATSVYAQGNTQPENPPATDPQASPSTSPPEKPPQILSPVVPAPREVQPGPASSDKKDQTTDPSTTHDRLFFALPNFLAIDSTAHVAPLTAGQKFKVAVRSSFDYVQYPWYAVLAGISQAQNSEPSYGQGAEGYAKRYATAFADGTIENFMVNAVVPSVLRTDPRYYQLGAGSFVRRTSYALSRLFITRTDSGHNTFNFAEIGGS